MMCNEGLKSSVWEALHALRSQLFIPQVSNVVWLCCFLFFSNPDEPAALQLWPYSYKKEKKSYRIKLFCLNIHILSNSVCFNIRPNVSDLLWELTRCIFVSRGRKTKRLWMFCAASHDFKLYVVCFNPDFLFYSLPAIVQFSYSMMSRIVNMWWSGHH